MNFTFPTGFPLLDPYFYIFKKASGGEIKILQFLLDFNFCISKRSSEGEIEAISFSC